MKITDEMIAAGVDAFSKEDTTYPRKELVENILTAALSASPAGVVKPWRLDKALAGYETVMDGSHEAILRFSSEDEFLFFIDAMSKGRIMSAIEPAGVGVETTPPQTHEVASAAADVMAERRRQVETEGWTPAHDDAHKDCSLAKAAAIYTVGATLDGPDRAVMDAHGASGTPGWMKELWPWGIEWWKPTDRRRDLVKAGALIIAEIERLDRAATEGEDNG